MAEAVERHRAGLDEDTRGYIAATEQDAEVAVRAAAADHLGAQPAEVALTDSTTMGLGLLYGGIRLRPGQEVLTTEHDFYSTHQSLALRAARDGVIVRRARLYDDAVDATAGDAVARLMAAVTPATRVVAVTWVHSGTGAKLPVRAIADALAGANAGRDPDDRALLCVDGVHALGVEDATVADLGCDFLVSGTHKWLFGPRGTVIVWGRFHLDIGKDRVASRTHEQASQLKAGLADTPGITLVTPASMDVSSGIVCFDVAGTPAFDVVGRLEAEGIGASVTPYREENVRIGTSIVTSPDEVDALLTALAALPS